MANKLPVELGFIIFGNQSIKDISNIRLVCNNFNRIFLSEYFQSNWRYNNLYNDIHEYNKKQIKIRKRKYDTICAKHGVIELIRNKLLSDESAKKMLFIAINNNQYELIEYLHKKYNIKDYFYNLVGKYGSLKLILHVYHDCPDILDLINDIIIRNDENIIKGFIDVYKISINLNIVARYCSLELFKYVEKYTSNNCIHNINSINSINRIIRTITNDNIILYLLISGGTEYNIGLKYGAINNNMELVEYCLKCGATNIEEAKESASRNKNYEIEYLLLEYLI